MSFPADGPRYSTREVRRTVWHTLAQHLLPLLLALLIFGLPHLIGSVMDGIADDYTRQSQAAYEETRQFVLPMFLSGWLLKLATELLYLLPHAYLIIGSAAIYVTFKS